MHGSGGLSAVAWRCTRTFKKLLDDHVLRHWFGWADSIFLFCCLFCSHSGSQSTFTGPEASLGETTRVIQELISKVSFMIGRDRERLVLRELLLRHGCIKKIMTIIRSDLRILKWEKQSVNERRRGGGVLYKRILNYMKVTFVKKMINWKAVARERQ